MRTLRFRQPSVLPGFGLTLGLTVTYLGLIVLLPLAAMVLRSAALGPAGFWDAVASARVLAAFRVSFGTALAAAAVNTVFGLLEIGRAACRERVCQYV